jgi:soluble lytic murein transglycosylase-like protein
MFLKHVLACCSGMVLSLPAAADLYSYTDSHGTTHLSNQRPDNGYRLFMQEPASGSASSAPSFPPIATASAPVSRKHAPAQWAQLIRQTADHLQLEERWLHAIISVESGYNPRALSSKGAIGLMQVMPATGLRFGVSELGNPQQNLLAGGRYLRSLHTRFNGRMTLVLAAYNAGEGAVLKYRNTIPPYRETRAYIEKVMRAYNAGAAEQGLNRKQAPAHRMVLVLHGDHAVRTESW